MGDKKSKKNSSGVESAQIPQWSGSQFSVIPQIPMEPSNKKILNFGSSNKMVVMSEGTIQSTDHDDLKQGSLYIVKIRNVSVALFQGWDDDMCCFAVLRSDSTPMRWSEARYIPGDFDAYDAFDDAGNPPVHLWSRHLRVNVPINWFSIFEEARRKQRSWMNEQNDDYYYPAEQPETPAHSGRQVKDVKTTTITPPQTDKSSVNQTPSSSGIEGDDAVSIDSNENQEGEHAPADGVENDDKGSIREEEAIDDQIEEAPEPAPIARTKTIRKSAPPPAANIRPSKSEITTEHAPAKKGVAAAAITTAKHEAPQPARNKSTTRESAAQPAHDPNHHQHHHHHHQQAPSPKYLSTPPASPVNSTPTHAKAQQHIYQPQMPDKQPNLFTSTDFAFPHNETQFSIQGNSFPESSMQNGAPSKNVTHESEAPTKSKRRSMQGFFRK